MNFDELEGLVNDIKVTKWISPMIKVKLNNIIYDLNEEYYEIDEEGDLMFILKRFKKGGMSFRKLQRLIDGSEASCCAYISVKLNGVIYRLDDECYEIDDEKNIILKLLE